MASSQYRKVADYTTVLYHPESPVVLESMRLQHDLIYDVNVLQITFRNVSPRTLYGLGIRLTIKDDKGTIINKDIEFNYYGIEIGSGRLFGAEDDIAVEPDAVKFEISVVRADLDNGKDYHGNALLSRAPHPKELETLGEFQEGFVERVGKLKPKVKIAYAHENTEFYWYCVCGRIYPKDMKACPICRLKNVDLSQIIPDLKEEKRAKEAEAARIQKEAEEAERKRLEEEERQRQEEERKRLEEETARLMKEAEEAEIKRRQEEEQARLEALKKKKMRKIITIAASCLCAIALAAVLIPKFTNDHEGNISIGDETGDDYEYNAEVTTDKTDAEKDDQKTDEVKKAEKMAITALMGDDLDETEAKTVWRLFGTTEGALDHETVYMSEQKQRAYMLDTLSDNHIEKRALSCVLIRPKDEGYGLKVKLYNITHCKKKTYVEVLKQIGITDADVIIAAPQKASGSTALASLYSMLYKYEGYDGDVVGIAKAYGSMNVRSGPSVSNPSYGTTKPGQKVQVIELLDNDWMKIAWDCPKGYAYTCYEYNGEQYYSFVREKVKD